MLLIGTAGCE